MNDDLWALARHCYGYGSWDGDYWFIGPEQGGSKEKMTKRAAAFRKLDLDKDGLCDCREFHQEVYEPGDKDWHRSDPPPTPLQSTWHYLILTLMSYKEKITLGNPMTGQTLSDYQRPFREYQRVEWGRSDGETCVIERSGINAKSFVESAALRASFSQAERAEFEAILRCRVKNITARIHEGKPEFVVIYSKSQHSYWGDLRNAGARISESPNEIFKVGPTLVAFAESRGRNNPRPDPWFELGQELRKHSTNKHTD
jgi:hypothetical protein